jgi:hypothetical protein
VRTPQVGDKIGSFTTFNDIYGYDQWLRYGSEHYNVCRLEVIEITLAEGQKALAVGYVMNRGDEGYVRLEDIARLEYFDKSFWQQTVERPGVPAWQLLKRQPWTKEREEKQIEEQGSMAVKLICFGVFAAAFAVIWMVYIVPALAKWAANAHHLATFSIQ